MIDKRHVAAALGVLVLAAVAGIFAGARVIVTPAPVPPQLRETCPREWTTVRTPIDDISIVACVRQAPEKDGPLVFILHGGGDGKMSFIGLGEKLLRAGFSVALVDARGHGESGGNVLSYGVFESSDLRRVRDFIGTHGYSVDRVGVIGFSYGAATSIMWAARDPHVAAVVAVAPYASLRSVAPGYTARMVPAGAWLPNFVTSLVVTVAGRLGGFDPDDSPFARAPKVATPTLLVHGEQDVHVPPGHSLILKPRLPNGELVIVPGMSHEDMFDHPRVFDAAVLWFRGNIQPRPSPGPPGAQAPQETRLAPRTSTTAAASGSAAAPRN